MSIARRYNWTVSNQWWVQTGLISIILYCSWIAFCLILCYYFSFNTIKWFTVHVYWSEKEKHKIASSVMIINWWILTKCYKCYCEKFSRVQILWHFSNFKWQILWQISWHAICINYYQIDLFNRLMNFYELYIYSVDL